VGEKYLGFRAAHLGRVADFVAVDVAFDPVGIGLFGADGLVFEADGVPSAGSGQARTWSSGFLSVDSIVSLQYALPLCGFRSIMRLLGNHTKIP
jgi:hypothetical protein